MDESATARRCLACGVGLGEARGIEGFCSRCLAASTWRGFFPSDDREAGAGAGVGEMAGSGPERRLGGYELFEEIGRGGMGVVYRARQVGLGREVALKVLRLGPWAGAGERERFRREARAAATLRHPNVVTVFDVGEEDGHAYLAMERIAGRTLAELANGSPLEPERAARYGHRIAAAVAAAHGRGILHRDLKPSNVLIDADDEPRVTDFGLAKLLAAEGDEGAEGGFAEVTRTGQLLGSPGYLPPEQADPGRGRVGFTSDVYALGATLYHLLTGRPPFVGATLTATLAQVLHDEPVPPRRLNSAVPRDLETICLKCLQKDPARRYGRAAEVAADLEAWLGRRPIRARPVGALERLWLGCRRRPALAVLGLALLVVAGFGIAGVLWQAEENRRNLYAADLRLASQAVEDGDLGRARELLEAHAVGPGTGDFAWRHLRHRAEGDPRRVLGRHPWIVAAVAWSPDGSRLASAGVGAGAVEGETRIWTVAGPDVPAASGILTNWGARHLAWFADGRRLLGVHADGWVRVWDVDRRTVEVAFPGRSGGASADGRWVAVCGGDPVVWSEHPDLGPVRVHDLVGAGSYDLPAARLVAISADGARVVSTDFGEELRVYERSGSGGSGGPRVLDSEGGVWALAFSPNGEWLVGTGFDRDVRCWRLGAGVSPGPPRRLRGHLAGTWGAAFAPGSQRLATTASDQTVCLWDLDTARLIGRLRGHGSEVWCAAYSPDGRWLASGGKDRQVILWESTPPETRRPIETRAYAPAVFSADGRYLATGATGDPGRSWLHDLDGSRDPAPKPVKAGWPISVVGKGEGVLVATGFRLEVADERGSRPDGGELEHGADEAAPGLWDLDGAGRVLVGAAADGGVSAWDRPTGGRRVRYRSPGLVPWRIVVSRDGGWLAVTAGERGVALGATTGGELTLLTGHADQAKDAAFSRDSRWLATASVDGTLKLWDVASRRERATLRGHRSEVTAVAFAPDGVTLASGETEHGVRLWHLPTRREVAVLAEPELDDWLGFSPDGRQLAIRLRGGRMRMLEAP